jgi:hypothetical protein
MGHLCQYDISITFKVKTEENPIFIIFLVILLNIKCYKINQNMIQHKNIDMND